MSLPSVFLTILSPILEREPLLLLAKLSRALIPPLVRVPQVDTVPPSGIAKIRALNKSSFSESSRASSAKSDSFIAFFDLVLKWTE